MTANRNIFPALIPAILVTAFLTGCASTSHFEGDDSYSKLAHLNGREPDPVIVIPGILGSRLVDGGSGRVVWGTFGAGAIKHGSAEGRRSIALPMHEGTLLTSLRDGVRVEGTLDRLSLGHGLGVNAYARLLQALAIGGYRDESFGKAPGEHFSCFQFGYDWRKSNAANASALDDFIEEKHRLVEEDYFRRHGVHKKIKFDIVAHSMGGLLARYYLMYGRAELNQDGRNQEVTWAGTRHVKRLIQVGTPNLGAALAFQEMRKGLGIIPLLVKVQPAVIGTFATPYELLPRNADHPLVDGAGKPIDLMDPAEWERYGWGLADPAQDVYVRQLLPDVPDAAARRRIALEHLRKSLQAAKAFHAAIDRDCPPPHGVEMHVFFGDRSLTAHRLQSDSRGRIFTIATLPGDGTVTGQSALAITADSTSGVIPWDSRHQIRAQHRNLPSDSGFIHSLLPLLLHLPQSPKGL